MSFVSRFIVLIESRRLHKAAVATVTAIIGAMATQASSSTPTRNFLAATFNSQLVVPTGASQAYGETLMLIKAMLQYSAQPLANFNLLQQGAGGLNVAGAIALAKHVRTDLWTRVVDGTISAGSELRANSANSMPTTSTAINGETNQWSRMVFVGGNRIVSGSALFHKYQPIWNPRIAWAGNVARERKVVWWSGTGITSNTCPQTFTDTAAPNQTLLTAGVVSANSLAGASSKVGKTGVFIPNTTLSNWLVSGSGTVLGTGLILSEGLVLSDGLLLSEGLVLGEP